MISRKVKIISSVAIIALIAAPIFFKKEKKFIEIIKNTSTSGIKSSLISTKDNGVIYVQCRFKNAGVMQNDLQNHGISIIAAHALFDRINGLNREETTEKLLKLGILGLTTKTSSDDFDFSFFVDKNRMKEALEFISIAFKNPTFSSEDLSYIKSILPDIPSQKFSLPEELINEKLLSMLFVDHPYGLNRTGTSQVVAGMGVDQVLAFIKSKLRPDCLHVIITGDVSRYESSTIVDTLFSGLQKPETQENTAESKRILSAKMSEEKIATITKSELDDLACVATGVRLGVLSKEEKAAAYVAISALFHSKYCDFIENLKSSGIRFSKYKADIKNHRLASIFTVTIRVKKEDLKKYLDFVDKKFHQYSTEINLKELDREKEYFACAANAGFTGPTECFEKIKNKELQYDDISKETFLRIMKMLFNDTSCRTVICTASE